jgi:hypothetical protein
MDLLLLGGIRLMLWEGTLWELGDMFVGIREWGSKSS